MTSAGGLQARAWAWCRANPHFLVALLILLPTLAATRLIGWTNKEPVPWAEGVKVGEDFRLLSLPERVGPFVLAENGDVSLKEDDLRLLGIGTSYDRRRQPQRCSNWYVLRYYRDTRIADSASPYAVWNLAVYYYTGLRDKAPHVAERCLVAGGARITQTDTIPVKAPALPEARAAWRQFDMRRIRYERDDRQGVEYYVFSLNGEPEARWENVRLTFSYPWVRHCYFAKIQLAPMGRGEISGPAEADQAARELLNLFLPTVLNALPTADDVRKLETAESPKD